MHNAHVTAAHVTNHITAATAPWTWWHLVGPGGRADDLFMCRQVVAVKHGQNVTYGKNAPNAPNGFTPGLALMSAKPLYKA